MLNLIHHHTGHHHEHGNDQKRRHDFMVVLRNDATDGAQPAHIAGDLYQAHQPHHADDVLQRGRDGQKPCRHIRPEGQEVNDAPRREDIAQPSTSRRAVTVGQIGNPDTSDIFHEKAHRGESVEALDDIGRHRIEPRLSGDEHYHGIQEDEREQRTSDDLRRPVRPIQVLQSVEGLAFERGGVAQAPTQALAARALLAPPALLAALPPLAGSALVVFVALPFVICGAHGAPPLLSPPILSRGRPRMRRHSPAVKKLDTKDGPLHRSCEGGRPGVVSASV